MRYGGVTFLRGACMSVAEKGWWGPRIWRILHSLAEINDRVDVGPAWRQALNLTADILPCVVCREHFRTRVRSIAFPIGVSNYASLRRTLWAIHAGTKASDVGAEAFPEEQLATEYGGVSREIIITRVIGLVTEVITAFSENSVLDRLHAASLTPWHRAMTHLINLLRWPQPPAPGRRRGVRR